MDKKKNPNEPNSLTDTFSPGGASTTQLSRAAVSCVTVVSYLEAEGKSILFFLKVFKMGTSINLDSVLVFYSF